MSRSDLVLLRARVARSRHQRTTWDYVLVDERGREVGTFDQRWSAILRREELARARRPVRIFCVGYGRVYRLAFPRGPLFPQFILVTQADEPQNAERPAPAEGTGQA